METSECPSYDESNLSYDQRSRTFIATLKTKGPYGRARAIWTSKDFEKWTNLNVLFHADELDQKLGRENMKTRLADPTLHRHPSLNAATCAVDVYNMGVSRYEDLYIGFPAMFHHNDDAGFHLVQLACSRDLRTWKRLGDRETFIGPSKVASGAYDLTQILPPTGAVIRGDELWFYYTGIKYRDPPKGAKNTGAVCLAVLRLDGFISLDTGDEEGTLLTESFEVTGEKLCVNFTAGTKGELRVEVLDKEGKVLATSVPLKGDLARGEVIWKKGSIAPSMGKAMSLRFTLRNAQFYSYWFEDA